MDFLFKNFSHNKYDIEFILSEGEILNIPEYSRSTINCITGVIIISVWIIKITRVVQFF